MKLRTAAAQVLAAGVLLACPALIIAGALLAREIGDHLIVGLFGLLTLAVAWEVRPRLPRLAGTPVTQRECPAAWQVVEGAASRLGVAPPGALVLDDGLHVDVHRIGLRGVRTIRIGVPAAIAYPPPERDALITAALALDASGDPSRDRLIGGAFSTLDAFAGLLTNRGERREYTVRTPMSLGIGTIDSGTINLSTGAANGMMALLSLPPRLLSRLLATLVGSASRHASTGAIERAESATGSAIGAIRKRPPPDQAIAQATRDHRRGAGPLFERLREARGGATDQVERELLAALPGLEERLATAQQRSLYQ